MTTPRGAAEKIVLGTVTITPNRLEMAWRYLLSRGDASVEELTSVLGVPALSSRAAASSRRNDDDPVLQGSGRPAAPADIVRAAEALGIFERRGAESVQRMHVNVDLDNGERYREHLETQLVMREGPQNIAEEVSWLLGQASPGGIEFSTFAGDDLQLISNAARFDQLRYWARYLGFAWFARLPGRGTQVVIPDPTEAIARRLRELLPGDDAVPLTEFLRLSAERMPVLEGGTVREKYEKTLPPGSARRDPVLSLSTAFALRRLEHRGKIKLIKRDDWPAKVIFPDPTASYLQRDPAYTHVQRGEMQR